MRIRPVRSLCALLGVVLLLRLPAGGQTATPPADGTRRVPRLPRIGVRDGRFVETASGRAFQPRGFHYIRLLPDGVHTVFAPSHYDAARCDAMLRELAAHRYNVVRVFIGALETTDQSGLSPRFMDNVCDFLSRAARHGIHVLPVVDWIPHAKRYDDVIGAPTGDVGGMQALFLSHRRIEAKARYLTDFIQAVRRKDPRLLSAVFAWEFENEACFQADQPPFSRTAGTFPFNGRAYDMASDADKQALADAGITEAANRLARAVRHVDPEAMVAYSVFTFAAVGRGGPARLRADSTPDARFPARPLALAKTAVSYVDVHLYAPSPEGVTRDLQSIEWEALRTACRERGKPLLVGEFGTFKAVHRTLPEAVYGITWYLRRILALGFAGAIYWTYDCDEQAELWNARSEGGAIFQALTRVWHEHPPRERALPGPVGGTAGRGR